MKPWRHWKLHVVLAYFWVTSVLCDHAASRRKETQRDILNYIQYLNTSDLFYLDPSVGNDTFNGKSPWREGPFNSGPFRTIGGAINSIRRLRRSLDFPVKLYLRSGFYHVSRQVRLSEADSNIEILGYPFDNERPVISGASRLSGWQFQKVHQLPNNHWIYQIRYEEECSGHLFIKGKRMVRARKPNLYQWTGKNLAGEGPYLLIKDLLQSNEKCWRNNNVFYQKCPPRNKAGFKFHEGDFARKPANFKQLQVVVFNSWTAERKSILDFTRDGRVFFQEKMREPIGTRPLPSGWRYIIENSLEDLDTVGEYYCDPSAKALYVIPPDERFLENFVYIGTNSQLFKVTNGSNITFNGVEIKYTHDDFVNWYNSKPGAIVIDNSTNIKVINCVIGHLGFNGIVVTESRDVQIYANHFFDIGNYGVEVGNSVMGRKRVPLAQDILIANNTFEGCGVYHMLQPSCIHVRGQRNIRVIGNDISRTPYAGIKVGWQKAFKRKHVSPSEPVFYIAENHIHDYGLAILSDFAGVYLSTNIRDCGHVRKQHLCHLHALVENNVIHNGRSYSYGAAAIYSDTASSSVTVTTNWLYDVGGPSINFHCGNNNSANNNMIVHVNPNRLFGTCNLANSKGIRLRQGFSMSHNVIYVENSDALMYRKGDRWDFDVPHIDFNVYFGGRVKGKYFFPKDNSMKKWRNETRNDLKSLITNPKYTSRSDRILTLKKNSPARQIGIKSVDLLSVKNRQSNKWIFEN